MAERDGTPGVVQRETVRREIPLWRTAAIAGLALAIAAGSLALIWLLAAPLAIFFVGVVIAQALAPVVDRLERSMPRVAAVVLIFAVIGLLLAGLVLLVLPPLAVQTQQAVKDLPQLLNRLGALINHIAPGAGTSLAQTLRPRIPSDIHAALSTPLSALAGLAIFAQIMFFAAYWLIAMPGLYRFSLSLVPEQHRRQVAGTLHEISGSMGGYVRGTVIDAVIVAIITFVFLLAMGVKYPLVLAIVAFLGEFVPLIGPTIAEIPAVMLGLLLSPIKAIIVLVFYIALQQIDGNVILPLILRGQANISPLLVVFAVFVGAWAGGIIGVLVAIPLAAALKVIVMRVIAPALQRWSAGLGPA